MLELKNVSYTVWKNSEKISILENVSLFIKKGEVCCLLGRSGSGKTSLLQIAGLLQAPTQGQVFIDNIHGEGSQKHRALLRRRIGFMYQFHHLLDAFTALENVMIPCQIKGESDAQKKSQSWLVKLGLEKRMHHKPHELSGGEKQRVALARALVTKPQLVLADEPTGNLDEKNAVHVFEDIVRHVKENNTAALIVTHDENLAQKADRLLHMP